MKKFLTLFLSILLGTTLLVGCSNKTETKENETKVEEKGDIVIDVPSGAPSLAFYNLVQENADLKLDGYNLKLNVAKTPDELATLIMKSNADIAIVPSSMAAVAYNKTNDYQILGTVGMGTFQLVTSEKQLTSIEDLNEMDGLTISNTGKGLTPDITAQVVLKSKGVDMSKLNLDYVDSYTSLLPTIISGKVTTAFLPEPVATIATIKNPELKKVASLNEEWKKAFNSEYGYPQSTLIVKKSFIENNKDNQKIIADIEKMIQKNLKDLNENPEKLNESITKLGIAQDPKVMAKTFKNLNLNFVKIDTTKDMYTNYYKTLFESNPKSIGGKLPDEKVYFVQE